MAVCGDVSVMLFYDAADPIHIPPRINQSRLPIDRIVFLPFGILSAGASTAGRSLVGHMPLPGTSRMSTRTAMLRPHTVSNRLFYDQAVLYGFDPSHASCYLDCLVDGLLRINKAA